MGCIHCGYGPVWKYMAKFPHCKEHVDCKEHTNEVCRYDKHVVYYEAYEYASLTRLATNQD